MMRVTIIPFMVVFYLGGWSSTTSQSVTFAFSQSALQNCVCTGIGRRISFASSRTSCRIRLAKASAAGGGVGKGELQRGGGFGKARASTSTKIKENASSNNNNIQLKKTNSKRRRSSSLAELAPSLQTLAESAEQSSASSSSSLVLDKWGLPPPTTEDIFPLLPAGTELRPVTKEQYTLTEIQALLKDYIDLQLERCFDEMGSELHPSSGAKPMQLRLLHESPPVLAIDHFFTLEECLQMEQVAMPSANDAKASVSSQMYPPYQVDSKTFSPLAQSKRTSTSWFCHYPSVPTLIAKAHHRLGIPIAHMEEPQIVRYRAGQEFTWHYDEVPPPQLPNGGQRVATLLVYLNTLPAGAGGGTVFRDLRSTPHTTAAAAAEKESSSSSSSSSNLCMRPQQGSALLFFPASRNGQVDDRTLHKGEVVQDGYEKRIIQMWIHQREYQAALPPGNSNQDAAAVAVIEETSRALGYVA